MTADKAGGDIYVSRPGILVLLADSGQVLVREEKEIWGTVKLEPGLDLTL